MLLHQRSLPLVALHQGKGYTEDCELEGVVMVIVKVKGAIVVGNFGDAVVLVQFHMEHPLGCVEFVHGLDLAATVVVVVMMVATWVVHVATNPESVSTMGQSLPMPGPHVIKPFAVLVFKNNV